MSIEMPSHDELKELFESDPVAFEAKRKELIDTHISSQPAESQDSLRKVQDLVDSKL